MTDEFKHYGIRMESGRYPWGSGTDDYQRSQDFYTYVDTLKQQVIASGVPAKNADREIARLIGESTPDEGGYSVADLRDTRTIAKETIVRAQVVEANKLRDKDWSIEAIATKLGISPASVRGRLKATEDSIKAALSKTADVIRTNVDKYDIVDIGLGVSQGLGISPERLRAASSLLRDEGYLTYTIPQPQVGSANFTRQLVMVKPGTTFGEARKMADRVHTMGEWTEDSGKTFFGIHKPLSVNLQRIEIKYDSPEDGTVYVRPGVADLDMGKNRLAQVRIAVNGTHFIKGMAVLRDDLPAGVDLQVHSNKKRGTPILGDDKSSVLKVMKDDPDNPFGSAIKKQLVETDPKTGEERARSVMNIVNEEGDWDDWRLSLPSQMLAKQPHSLIKSQLKVTQEQTKARIDELNKITNPVVRKKKLEDYAEQIDADAVDLRAAALPGQRTQVIIPVPGLSENQIYAPRFKTGDDVVLIRYPHGGRFEIPEVQINNNHRGAKKLLGNAPDAIGINPKVAEKLSGADFDGDTVIVIPNPKGAIKGIRSAPISYQKAFEGFNPKEEYGGYEVVGTKTKKDGTVEDIGNYKLMKNTGLEMGKITNLITDMQVQGAQPDHVIRAVKHSMVVIDAEKHKLDYRRSEKDRNIAQLRDLYQKTVLPDGSTKVGGASTLLSKATAGLDIPQQKLRAARDGGRIDPKTGALVTVDTGRTQNKYDAKTKTYMDGKDGRPLIEVPKMDRGVKRLSLTDDAYTLTRDKNDRVESLYADHANAMKAAANDVRLQAARIKNPLKNKAAYAVYKDDVDKLTADLRAAQALKPLERRAQQYAATTVRMKRTDDPSLYADRDRKKKVEKQALQGARDRLGLQKQTIEITDRQWDAIQSGGVTATTLRKILDYADPKRVEELSIPRKNTVMTSAVSSRAKAMLAAGKTTAEIAASLGIPASTLAAAVDRGEL